METLRKIVAVLAVIGFAALLLSFPTMWLWNWLMPKIFGLIEISFWEALGLNLLTGVFFRQDNSKKE